MYIGVHLDVAREKVVHMKQAQHFDPSSNFSMWS